MLGAVSSWSVVSDDVAMLLSIGVVCGSVYAWLALVAKRLRDLGRPGWWSLALLAPPVVAAFLGFSLVPYLASGKATGDSDPDLGELGSALVALAFLVGAVLLTWALTVAIIGAARSGGARVR
jgi:uncharacterized membrane protein YhaH (DUF805 family)